MTLAAIKDQLATMEIEERKCVMAYLGGLQIRDDDSFREKLSRCTGNIDANNWLNSAELDERLKSLSDD